MRYGADEERDQQNRKAKDGTGKMLIEDFSPQ